MPNEQILTDMLDVYRERLAEEQLRLAHAIADRKRLERNQAEQEKQIRVLEEELEKYRVPTKTETIKSEILPT
jgi:hypothetical protein